MKMKWMLRAYYVFLVFGSVWFIEWRYRNYVDRMVYGDPVPYSIIFVIEMIIVALGIFYWIFASNL